MSQEIPIPYSHGTAKCPVCEGLCGSNEILAYGRCESCYTEPRVGMPLSISRPKRRPPKKSRGDDGDE